MEYKLTDEQSAAIDLSLKGDNLKIEAYAGAGKTSTLKAIGKALENKRGLYLAFNKVIATEAKQSFPENVDCRTAHSLAFKELGFKYAHRLQRLSGGMLVNRYLKLKNGVFNLTKSGTGYLILDTMRNFIYSADEEIMDYHIPKAHIDVIDEVLNVGKKDIIAITLPLVKKTWKKMIDPDDDIPITHDVYLKLWAMSDPIIKKDFILFDEAQDANASMLKLVSSQQAQQIYVGDRYQQIYKWRGAVNAMDKIRSDKSCVISQSFRFGQAIADVANRILNSHLDADVNIRGFDLIESDVRSTHSPDTIICRTNAALIDNMIIRIKKGDKVAINGGCKDILYLIKSAKDLIEGRATNHHDLFIFRSWDEVVEYSETESGTDMKALVNICENYDIDEMIEMLSITDKMKLDNADILLSTAHKSKGLQWSKVRLNDDFRHPKWKSYTSEESNLVYVAATRAVNVLDISDCDAANYPKIKGSEDGE